MSKFIFVMFLAIIVYANAAVFPSMKISDLSNDIALAREAKTCRCMYWKVCNGQYDDRYVFIPVNIHMYM